MGSDRAHKVLHAGEEDDQVGDAEEQGPDGDETAKRKALSVSASGVVFWLTKCRLTVRIGWFPGSGRWGTRWSCTSRSGRR